MLSRFEYEKSCITSGPDPPMFQSRRVDRKDKEAVKEANMYYSIESGEL